MRYEAILALHVDADTHEEAAAMMLRMLSDYAEAASPADSVRETTTGSSTTT